MPPKPLTTIYKEIHGTKITTDIYLPENAPRREKYPVLITIHGGAFMLGHSSLISLPQVDECLARGWIVVAPNHRLCPQVSIAEGPVRDCRDLLEWVYSDGEGLDGFLSEMASSLTGDGDGEGEEAGEGQGKRVWQVDKEKVMAMGTSSGGFLALALGYDTPRPPAAILNFYGAVHFTHPFWSQPLPHVQKNLPALDQEVIRQVYDEVPVPIRSGISLEGQSQNQSQGQRQNPGPNLNSPRDLFALTQIANGTVISTCLPSSTTSSTSTASSPSASEEEIRKIDPIHRIHPTYPPTCIIHGTADRMVPNFLSKELLSRLQEHGVRCEMVDVEGEDHTFAMGMVVGGRTWEVQRRGFDFLEEVISTI